jgi:hypothetical protein
MYQDLFTWFWDGSEWSAQPAPITRYLQNNGSTQANNAGAKWAALKTKLTNVTKIKNVNTVKTFNYDNWDYINNSIKRTFIGKATPWEIQETLQIASQVGAVNDLRQYCESSLGVDCGGFVAAYWGEACPHMVKVDPLGFDGILPRNFWASGPVFPDAQARRRTAASKVRRGDAAIFFKDVENNNPDQAKQRDPTTKKLIEKTGSEAFHIGLVNDVGYSGSDFTSLEIAESAGDFEAGRSAKGVNVRSATVQDTGMSGKWVYCQTGANTRVYFVEPPAGWGPETAYQIP